MRYGILIAGFLSWGGLLIIPVVAHHGPGGHHGSGCRYCASDHHCNGCAPAARGGVGSGTAPAEAQAIEGKVAEVAYLPGVTPDDGMVEIRVLAAGKSTLVRLTPVGLLKQKQLVLREGDAVSVRGYVVEGMDGDLLVATEVYQGGRRVVLRDSRGRLIR
jgi:hypothetical protein